MFNYSCRFGLPGNVLQTSPENTPFWHRLHQRNKKMCLEDSNKDMFEYNVVKYCVYLDMGVHLCNKICISQGKPGNGPAARHPVLGTGL